LSPGPIVTRRYTSTCKREIHRSNHSFSRTPIISFLAAVFTTHTMFILYWVLLLTFFLPAWCGLCRFTRGARQWQQPEHIICRPYAQMPKSFFSWALTMQGKDGGYVPQHVGVSMNSNCRRDITAYVRTTGALLVQSYASTQVIIRGNPRHAH